MVLGAVPGADSEMPAENFPRHPHSHLHNYVISGKRPRWEKNRLNLGVRGAEKSELKAYRRVKIQESGPRGHSPDWVWGSRDKILI